jgi:hypothetical protein
VVDAIPTLAWTACADGSCGRLGRLLQSARLNDTGLSSEQACDWGWTVALHSDDLNGLIDCWRSVLASGDRRS